MVWQLTREIYTLQDGKHYLSGDVGLRGQHVGKRQEVEQRQVP